MVAHWGGGGNGIFGTCWLFSLAESVSSSTKNKTECTTGHTVLTSDLHTHAKHTHTYMNAHTNTQNIESVGKAPAVQAQGPKFKSPEPR